MLKVGLSKYGRGVFVNREVPEGELIESCPTLLVPKLPLRPDSDLECQLRRYAFAWSEELDAIALGLGSIYNHSAEPNLLVVADKHKGTINFFARRLIKAGEELTSSYGFDPRFQAFTKAVETKIDGLRRKARAEAVALEQRSALTLPPLDDRDYEEIFEKALD